MKTLENTCFAVHVRVYACVRVCKGKKKKTRVSPGLISIFILSHQCVLIFIELSIAYLRKWEKRRLWTQIVLH